MVNSPLISVIMSVYNSEKYITESLISIFDQSFQDIEIVIYDDASTDNTWNIINDVVNEFCCFNRRLIRGERNIGCGAGRNIAIENACGKYIAIQDGDDISFIDRLKEEVIFLESRPDLFCAGAWAIKIDFKGDVIGNMEYPPKNFIDVYKEINRYHNPIIDPSCMFRREMFCKIGKYLDNWKLVPDFNLWIRSVLNGYKIENIQKYLIYYRKHPDSITTRFQPEAIREHILLCNQYLKTRKLKVF